MLVGMWTTAAFAEITEVSKTLELEPPWDPVIPLVYDGNEAFLSNFGFSQL